MSFLDFVLFLSGFALLLSGAHFLVDGGIAYGRRRGIPDIVIGLTIVSFGTSAPEMAISMMASADGITDLAISNVIGSNIFNTFVIIGVAAVIYPISVRRNTLFKEFPWSAIAAILLMIFAVFLTLNGPKYILSRLDGFIFLIFFAGFIYYNYRTTKKQIDTIEIHAKTISITRSIVYVTLGLVMLFVGGKLVVIESVKIASTSGISERIIGLTIVAVATSLPELVTSAVAAFKRNSDIAIGNALGSNIFNIFLVLGLSSIIRPLPAGGLGVDIWVAISSNFLIVFFVLALSPKNRIINRPLGAFLILCYLAYIIYILRF